MDNWLALFDGQTRYTLDITDSRVTPDVLRFKGREALSEPFRWTIDFTTPQDNLTPEEVLMKYATLRMRSGKAVHGIITRLEWLSTTADQSHYQVELSSRLALLSRNRQCRIFQHQSVPEVVEQVLRRHGLEGPDFDFRLERTYPPREIITQWRETDLEFIRRILSEVGIYWRTEMEDKRGEEHIKLATEYGKTQLNSGHLVDAQEQPRGKGFELRTDEHGVIRVAKGLFVTADGQQKAAGGVLEMSTALREIDVCLKQLQQLEMAAEHAQALKADIDSQIQMFEQRLNPLNETLLFSAPEGVAVTSGEHMQMTATKNVAVNAGGDISAGVMGNMTALVGEKLGLFARTGQLSLKASEGPVEMQAQNGRMQLFAEKKLTLSSASDITFAGKKRITLIGGGSYLRLEAGKVEYGTTATYLRRVRRTMKTGPASLPLNLPLMPLVDLFTSRLANPPAGASQEQDKPQEQDKTKLKPVLRISDAPGINGVVQPGCKWQIVLADSYMQAVTTDEVLMNGQSDSEGQVLQSEDQQYQLTELAKQYANQLWLVVGHRAHRLYFNVIPAATDEDVKDFCAQDTMGFHRIFNRISGNILPGEKLKQCIKTEQQVSGVMLESLRESK
ncbi:type VI secretion system tip protein VgrG [Enterobacter hormaechei]|uniref:type VI secretion system tip protein VgrG n=1 Tax=Enterobacter hormaechei TaxID=158836 RepID=UPI002DBD5375|nr:type VI secretion system tip protein VgrG [Enterobacter hormaechei]MEB6526498.1 type VI secretion system tip protein VgrG [Enterobacter hormaechei]